jgi:RNA polymerase sigma-70 factor (ECF subfamily)
VITDAGRAAARPSEINLVREALDGDADAFASLFHLHKHRVFAVCLRMTNNTAEADDLTQEVFIQAFRKLSTFRGESALSTWLYRLAVNTALMHLRRHLHRQVSLDDVGGHDGAGLTRREHGRPDDRLRSSIDRIALVRALEALPHGYRTIFELHEIRGYGHREIARLLHCSVGNSKSQLHKAKERIRECLFPGRRTPVLRHEGSTPAATREQCAPRASDAPFRPVSMLKIHRSVRQPNPQETEPMLALGSSTQCVAETAV